MFRMMLVVLFTGLLAACTALPAEEHLPALNGTWTVKLTQSGGFAGRLRNVTITSDGHVIALDERAHQTGTLQLSASQLAELKEKVSAALVGPIKTEIGCADCFLYDLKIMTANGSFSAQLDDVSLPESGLQPLVMYLLDLMEQALSIQ